MLESNAKYHDWQQILTIAVAILSLIVGFWGIQFVLPVLLGFWLIMGIANLRLPAEKKILPDFHWTDAVLALLLFYEFIHYFYSIYPPNSLFHIEKILYFILLFYMLRLAFQKAQSQSLLFIILGTYGPLLAIGAFFGFLFLQAQLRFEGWFDASQFKALFSPYGMLTNEWATLSVGFLAFPLVLAQLFRKSKAVLVVGLLAFAFVNVGALITFSRGAYLSVAVFWLVALGLVVSLRCLPLKWWGQAVLIVGVSVLALMLPSAKPFMTTLAMNKTVAQQRSTQGRMDIIERSLCQFKAYPWLGVGGDNYPIINDTCKEITEDQGYSRFTNNTYLQILLEKGILGFVLYGLFFGGLTVAFLRKIWSSAEKERQLITILLFAGFVAFAFRELFFSTFFYSSGAMTLFAVMSTAAFVDSKRRSPKHFWRMTAVLWIAVGSFVVYQKNQFQKAENQAKSGLAAYAKGNAAAAISLLNDAIALQPKVVPYYALRGLVAAQTNANVYHVLGDSILWRQEQLAQATQDFSTAIALNPFDGGYHFNRAWLQYLQNRSAEPALTSINRALELDPNVVAYQVGAGMLLEHLRDTSAAFAKYERAIRLSPELLNAPFFAALQKRHAEKSAALLGQIERDFQEQLDTAYNTVLAAKFARLLLHHGRLEQAKILLNEVIAELPSLNRPYYYLAMIYRQEGNDERALQLLQKSAILDFQDELVQLALGDVFYERTPEEPQAAMSAIYHYRMALRQRLDSVTPHYAKSNLKYQRYVGLRNDLLLKDLFHICQPDMDFAAVTERLAVLYAKMGKSELAQHYRLLSHKDPHQIQSSDIIDR